MKHTIVSTNVKKSLGVVSDFSGFIEGVRAVWNLQTRDQSIKFYETRSLKSGSP